MVSCKRSGLGMFSNVPVGKEFVWRLCLLAPLLGGCATTPTLDECVAWSDEFSAQAKLLVDTYHGRELSEIERGLFRDRRTRRNALLDTCADRAAAAISD